MAQGAVAGEPTNSQRHNNHELSANLIGKVRNVWYPFPLAESISRLPVDGRRKPWLFETLAHNLPREPGRGGDFLNDIARNSLKKLVSQK